MERAKYEVATLKKEKIAYWVALWLVYTITYVPIALANFSRTFSLALFGCSVTASICAGFTARKMIK